MKYVDNLKSASAAEFDEAEADWRDTVGRRFEDVGGIEFDEVPTPEELDKLDPGHAIGEIDDFVGRVHEAAYAWDGDTEEWGKVAKARIEARRKRAA